MGKDSHCQRVRVEEEKHPQSRRHISKVLVAFQTPSILTRQEILLWWPLSSVHVRETRIMNDTSLCFVGSSDFPWTITDLVILRHSFATECISASPNRNYRGKTSANLFLSPPVITFHDSNPSSHHADRVPPDSRPSRRCKLFIEDRTSNQSLEHSGSCGG